jgi:hypothetical protein
MEALAITGLTIAGKSLFGKVIYDTYDLVKISTIHPAVNQVLSDIDLEADLEVIEALIKDIEKNGGVEHEQSPLAICLHQVDRMVHMIRDELKLINMELDAHGEKWMARWRTPNYRPGLDRLVNHKKILDKRVARLIELMRI